MHRTRNATIRWRRGNIVTGASRPREAFSLIEVLIATIILALGLIGIGAIFPVVITQQRDATDLSAAVTIGGNAESLLQERLGRFESSVAALSRSTSLNDADKTRWYQVGSRTADRSEEAYLQMPSRTLPGGQSIGSDGDGNKLDLRVRQQEAKRIYPVLPGDLEILFDGACGPLDYTTTDSVQILIEVYNRTTRQKVDGVECTLGLTQPPADPGGSIGSGAFMVVSGDSSLFDELLRNELVTGQDCVSQPIARINVALPNPGSQIAVLTVTYRWLDDRIVADHDRFYPSTLPRYGWEMAFRRSSEGQVQYCLFMYRVDGNGEDHFHTPVNRDSYDDEGIDGLIRLARGNRIVLDTSDPKNPVAVLRDMDADLEENVDRGVWILPVNGTGPVRVRRARSDGTWELESVPMVNVDNRIVPGVNMDLEIYFLPLQVETEHDGDEPVEWRITPLLAYTKQVSL